MQRMWTLDGLRGLAAISVVIYHGLYWHEGRLYSSAGKYAVYLFFILSALTLAKVYRSRFDKTLDSTNTCYLCGNQSMIHDAYELLRGKGFSGDQIFTEAFF